MDIHGERENVQDDVEKSHKPRNCATSQEYERRTICEDVDIKRSPLGRLFAEGLDLCREGLVGGGLVEGARRGELIKIP